MGIIISLIAFPVIIALILLLVKGDKARGSLISAAAVIMTAGSIAVTVMYFASGECSFGFNSWLTEYIIMAVSALLAIFIIYICLKNRKYLPAVFALAQTAAFIVFGLVEGYSIKVENDIHADRFSMIMLIITALAGGLIAAYASGYMKKFHDRHPYIKDGRNVFFFSMFISVASVMGLVVSNNVTVMYLFWELIVLMSYVMASYGKDKEAEDRAFRGFTVNMLGGVFFVAGIVILGTVFGTIELDTMILTGSVYGDVVAIPVLFFALSGMMMAMQMPFAGGFVKAFSVNAPADAFMSTVTLVNGGVFIIAKLSAVLGISNFAGITVMIVGGITFFTASICAVSSKDIQKTAALSTVAVAGLMVALGGIGSPEGVWACIMLMILHTFAKSLILLSGGKAQLDMDMYDGSKVTFLRGKRKSSLCMLTGVAVMIISFLELALLRANVVSSVTDSGNILLMVMIAFGCGAVIVFGIKMIGEISYSAACASMTETVDEEGSAAGEEIESSDEKLEMSVKIMVVISVLVSIVFPLISIFAVAPYIEEAFGGTSSMFSISDSITGIIMIVFVVLIAGAFYQKKGKISMPERSVIDDMKENIETSESLCFNERRIVIAGTAASAVMIVIGVGFIIGTLVSLLGGAV